MQVDIGGGMRLFFDVAGTTLDVSSGDVRAKPTLLVLHGGPGFDHLSMRPWFDRFADIAQVVWYDHRGQGRSDGWDDPSGWNLDTWSDDVVHFCAALGITDPVVLGNSFGGIVAMNYATRHPQHPSRLILSSTSARRDVDRKVEAFRRLHGDDVAAVADAFWHDPGSHGQRYREVCFPLYTVDQVPIGAASVMNVELLNQWVANETSHLDLLPALARIACPTLVLAGVQDPVCPIEDALDIVDALPPEHVRFEQFDECGHGSFRDQPDRTESVIREFVAAR